MLNKLIKFANLLDELGLTVEADYLDEIIKESAKKKKKKKERTPTKPELWSRAKAKAKAKYDVWPSAYCVPMNYEALTKSGWKTYPELNIGDEILSYDISSDTLKWTQIKNLHFYNNAKTVDMVKPGHNVRITCTPEHKWLYFRHSIRRENNIEKAQIIYDLLQKLKNREITFSEARKQCSPIQRYYKKYKDCTLEEFLAQSKLSKGGTRLIQTKDLPNNGMLLTSARLDDSYPDYRHASMNKYQKSIFEMVLQYSVSQLDSFFNAAIVYDGNQAKNEDGVEVGRYGFKQKHKDHGDAFEIAAFMTGRNVRRCKAKDKDIYSYSIVDRRYIPLTAVRIEEGIQQDVWCPETDFGTWVVRGDDRIMITGNSVGFALKEYKKMGGGWRGKKPIK
jgi:hypothetical protein